jgi:hypothetical protein
LSASAELDNLFGRSNNWELYPHGLGDLDRLCVNSSSYTKNTAKNSQKSKRKKI